TLGAFRHGKTVAGEDHLAFKRVIRCERKWSKILFWFEGTSRLSGNVDDELILVCHYLYSGGELKRDPIIVTGAERPKACTLEFFHEKGRRLLRAGFTGPPALQRIRCEEFHIRFQRALRNGPRGGGRFGWRNDSIASREVRALGDGQSLA